MEKKDSNSENLHLHPEMGPPKSLQRKEHPHCTGKETHPPNTDMGPPPPHTRKGTPPHTENTSHSPKPTEEPLAPIQKRGAPLPPGRAVLKATWFCLRHVSRPPLAPRSLLAPRRQLVPQGPREDRWAPRGSSLRSPETPRRLWEASDLPPGPPWLPHIPGASSEG